MYQQCMSIFKGIQGKEQTYIRYSAEKKDYPLPDLLGFAHFTHLNVRLSIRL